MEINSRIRLQIRLQNIIFIVLLIMVAGLIAWLSTRYTYQADWTNNNRYTLSEASQQVLAQMPDPLTITVYISKNDDAHLAIKRLLKRYERQKANLIIHFVDPDTVPAEVRKQNIQYREVILNYQGRSEHVDQWTEQSITNALQRVARAENFYVAFLEGHGERSIFKQAQSDLSQWAEQLKNRGFNVQAMNFAKTSQIPDNTSVLVIVSPQVKLLPGEVSLIVDYIDKGGNLFWLLDPASTPLQGLESLAEKWGLKVQPGTIVDPTSRLFKISDPAIVTIAPELAGYGQHPITADFQYLTVFPQTSGLQIEPPPEWKSTVLLKTFPKAWSETGKLEGEIEFNEGNDVAGPLNIGIALTRDVEQKDAKGDTVKRQQRIIITGDSDFLSNLFLSSVGNADLSLRMVNWLARNDTFINVPTKAVLDQRLQLSRTAAILIGLFFLFVLPLGLLSMGGLIWLRRRKA